MPSVQIQHAHAPKTLGKNSTDNPRMGNLWACRLLPFGSLALRSQDPPWRIEGRGPYAQERIGVQWRTASGVWFIVPSVFQKTVKTVKNRE